MDDKQHVDGKKTHFFSVLLLGKTGQGKSTTGNKLVEACDCFRDRSTCISQQESPMLRRKQAHPHCRDVLPAASASPEESSSRSRRTGASSLLYHQYVPPDDDPFKCFEEGTGVESCTRKTSVISRLGNKEVQPVKVIDTPGFADSSEGGELGVFRANLAMFRDLIRIQTNEKTRINRAVYFLPVRGSLEKADGNIQEEIKVMHHFFGNAVFDCMVAVATLQKRKQESGFDEQDMKETKQAFTKALELAPIAGDRPSCPPIIFIGVDDTGKSILHQIKSAPVKSYEGFTPDKFVEGACTKCAAKYIRHAKDPDNPDNRIGVTMITEDGEEMCIPYQSSKCHPMLVPKYSLLKRTAGGTAHVVTLGVPMGINLIRKGVLPWPTFTSKDEMCIKCHGSPGSEGCEHVQEKYIADLPERQVSIYVDHTNFL